MTTPDLSIASLRERYLARTLNPVELVEALWPALAADDSHHVWITPPDKRALLAHAQRLQGLVPEALPLYGIPFAIKDNIDLALVPTTAGCPDFAYTPTQSAPVVQRLLDAGAIPLGKTNMDQFATGLVGTRSPYGECLNSFDPAFISGGSSSGSAVAVARGLASFSLGTDTAGSGRIPAAFNNIIGFKPTRGVVPAAGVVPACRTLDTVSIFALSAQDASRVFGVARGRDACDAFSRDLHPAAANFSASPLLRVGIPRRDQLEFFGNAEYERLFQEYRGKLREFDIVCVEIDFAPFVEAAALLYQGPWVAERYAAVRTFLETSPASVDAVVAAIIGQGRNWLAVDAFTAHYRLQELQQQARHALACVDCVLTPTAGTHFRRAEICAEPVALNTRLGYYTNFMNLLDLAAVAVPAGFTRAGLPFGVTLFANAHSDMALLGLAARLQTVGVSTTGSIGYPLPMEPDMPAVANGTGMFNVAVCGAHMAGLPLNRQLAELGATFVRRTTTAATYRFFALPGGPPHRPGLMRCEQGGGAIELEVWQLPETQFGKFMRQIPAPLGIGTIELVDGSKVQGFLCEAHATVDATDITACGGWRNYLATLPA